MFKSKRGSVKKATQPCGCCSDPIDELKLKKCSGCNQRVCKKCLAKELCHVCKVKTSPSSNNAIELKKMKKEKLMQIMKSLHFEKTKYKSLTVDEMVQEIIGRMTKEPSSNRLEKNSTAPAEAVTDTDGKGLLIKQPDEVDGVPDLKEEEEEKENKNGNDELLGQQQQTVEEEDKNDDSELLGQPQEVLEEENENDDGELPEEQQQVVEEVEVLAIALEDILAEDDIRSLSEGQLKALLQKHKSHDWTPSPSDGHDELVEEVSQLWKSSKILGNGRDDGSEEEEEEEQQHTSYDGNRDLVNELKEEEEEVIGNEEDSQEDNYRHSAAEVTEETHHGTDNVPKEEEEEEKVEDRDVAEELDNQLPNESHADDLAEVESDIREEPWTAPEEDQQEGERFGATLDADEPADDPSYEDREPEPEMPVTENGYHPSEDGIFDGNDVQEETLPPSWSLEETKEKEVIILRADEIIPGAPPPLRQEAVVVRKKPPQLKRFLREQSDDDDVDDRKPKTPGIIDEVLPKSLPFEIRITDESYMGGPEDRTPMVQYLKTLDESQVNDMQEFMLRAVLRSFGDGRKDLWKRDDLVEEVKRLLRQVKEDEAEQQDRRPSIPCSVRSQRNSTSSIYSTMSNASQRQSLLTPLLDIPLEDIQTEKDLHRLTTRQLQSILEVRGITVDWHQPRVHLLREVRATWEKERALVALEAMQEEAAGDDRPLRLQDFGTEDELRDLSIPQMKSILQYHSLSYKGEERAEMFIRLKKLWREQQSGF